MLIDYREKISDIDKEICNLLEKRFYICKKIGDYKKENNIDILDSKRELEVRNKISTYIKNEEYEDLIIDIFQDIMDKSKLLQK
ncbi:chorismate mutase [Peptostreptococcus equinus]|uniref:Chorismate mutase n=1 Tax=Peptostreptococcus equinus TaxID=3003601 RepID=A0ABY7JN34_9FIRM|nr:chorismate mutase [Peptostreptococcus sp. CBA3647]WAW14785.1 chorismate mutase [Peptostreptococcus sp. CBA3647]